MDKFITDNQCDRPTKYKKIVIIRFNNLWTVKAKSLEICLQNIVMNLIFLCVLQLFVMYYQALPLSRL